MRPCKPIIKPNRIITRMDRSVTAIELIERYNTALAQATLYRATRMITRLGDSYLTVFKCAQSNTRVGVSRGD
ncbi:MAG: DUF790 family protein [Armatimonadota bacterium]